MRGRWVLGALLLPGALVLSGCMGPLIGLGDGDPVPAPVWEPGYFWSYDVEANMFARSSDGRSVDFAPETHRSAVSYRVINTTGPLEGEDVYYVVANATVDSILHDSRLQALTKSDLEASGEGATSSYATPAFRLHEEDSSWPPAPDPCAGRLEIQPISPEDRLGFPTFPLVPGDEWGGVWPIEEEFDLRFHAKVHEPRRVTVPAGTFEAIPVIIDLEPATPIPLPDDGDFRFDMQVQTWYSPEVRWNVLTIIHLDAAGSFLDERFEFRQEMEIRLSDYGLEAGPAEPAPYVPNVDYSQPRYYAIQTDTAFPVNLADGPVDASFRLAESKTGVTVGPDGMPRMPVHMGDLETANRPDPETYVTQWRLARDGEGVVATGQGDSFSYRVADGGRYSVEARVVPTECNTIVPKVAASPFATFWEKEFHVPVEMAAVGPEYFVTEFPVGTGFVVGLASWEFDREYPVTVDDGMPRFYDANGTALAYPQDYLQIDDQAVAFVAQGAGQWSMAWEPEGQATLGDDVTIKLRIHYPGPGDYPYEW